MTTPTEIKELQSNQIFVFGSNLNGNHAGGAAAQAHKDFGAEMGVGEGLTGQCYAFPTLDKNMQKVSTECLIESKNRLYACARDHANKQFLVTKVGCGIAGFTEEEMKEVFKGDKPANIILPAGWVIIRGYKAFNKGLVCRDFQFELGKEFVHEGKIGLCSSGFHFCENMWDVFAYYPMSKDTVICEIEARGNVITKERDNKSVTDKIYISKIVENEQISKVHDYIERIKNIKWFEKGHFDKEKTDKQISLALEGFGMKAKIEYRDLSSSDDWGAAGDAARGAARGAAMDAAMDAVWDAALVAAMDAARGAAGDAARVAAWDAEGNAARGAAVYAVWDAARVAARGAEEVIASDLPEYNKKYPKGSFINLIPLWEDGLYPVGVVDGVFICYVPK